MGRWKGSRKGAGLLLAQGASGASWNAGSAHRKHYLSWRWGVGGASKWVLQLGCMEDPPELCCGGERVQGTALEDPHLKDGKKK